MSGRALIGILILASACQLAGPPQLVRDGAGIFSAEARATAESRLRAVAAEHGVWALAQNPLGLAPTDSYVEISAVIPIGLAPTER